jgi:CRISPR-associated protein Csa5
LSEKEILFDNTARMLAVLMNEQESYTYVDKLRNAPSRDLAIFYLGEAMRDYHSILSRGFEKESSENEAKRIVFTEIEKEIDKVKTISDRKEIREIVSLISAKALTILGKLKVMEEELKGK